MSKPEKERRAAKKTDRERKGEKKTKIRERLVWFGIKVICSFWIIL